MANTVIALKKSGTPSATPASLEFGELAINYADGVLYYKAANGSIYPFSSGGNAFATVNANGTLVVADTASDVFSLVPGNFINITGDGVNDAITISANVKVVYDTSNAAFDKANTSAKVTMSNTAPIGAGSGDFWWNSDLGRLFVYYNDGDTSQWVEATALLGPDYGLVYDVANAAFDKANTSVAAGLAIVYDATNAAFSTANSAFDKANNAIANTSNVIIYGDLRVTGTLNVGNSTTTITTSNITANNITISSKLIVNSVDILTTVNQANTSYSVANAAFDKANAANILAFNTGSGANAFASATIAGANAAVGTGANTVGSAAFARANTANTTATYAFDKANAGSNVTFTQFVIKGGGNVNIIYANSNSSSFNIETGNGVTYSNTANGINLGLTTTGVTAGYYGANNVIPIIDVDQFGRVRSVTNVAAQAASVNGTVIINATVGNQKLANVSQGTVKGRANTGTGEVEDLSFTQFVNSLPTFTTTDKGVVPATGPLLNRFLRDDATWIYINPTLANTAFDFANTANALAFRANVNAIAAFAQANIAIANVNYVNTAMQAAFAQVNIAIANVNYVNTAMQSAFAQANIAYGRANAAMNAYTGNVAYSDASHAYLTGSINTTTAGWQKVPINTIFFDNDFLFDAANNSFIARKPGYYTVHGRARTDTSGLGAAAIAKNGIIHSVIGSDTGSSQLGIGGSTLLYLNGTTDNVSLFVYTTLTRTYTAGLVDTWLAIEGPLVTTNSIGIFANTLNASFNTANAAFDKANSVSGGGVTLNAQNTAPTGVANNLWFNTDTGEMYVYFTDWDGTSQWTQINGGSGGGAFKNVEYYHMFFYPGFVDSNVTMYLNMSPTNYALPANLVGSYARVGTAPTGNGANLRIMKNNSFVGNISFARNNTNGTFVFTTSQSFAPGDVFRIMSPTVFDSAMSDIAITLVGSKS